MIEKQTKIILYRGATSIIKFDFTAFIFQPDSHCEFVMTTLCNDEIIKRFTFNESKIYEVVFEDSFTKDLKNKEYRYNIMYFVGDQRYPQCENSEIEVKDVLNHE